MGSAAAGVEERLRGTRRLAWATAAATLLLIAMGGAVRATDSGLACPDWPACYGQWVPPADLNIWMEHSHRLWAGVVGLLLMWLTVRTFRQRRVSPVSFRLSLLAIVLVVAQAALGAAVVLLQLRAGLVTSHLGMSLIIVACLIVIAVRSRPVSAATLDTPGAASAGAVAGRIGRWAGLVAAGVFVQALLGGQATGRGAAYVFNAVPFWLADDVWTGHVREVLHVTHRAAGYLVATAVIVFAVAARRRVRTAPAAPAWTRRLPALAAGLVLVQVALGVANVLTKATVWSAIAHLAVASWLWAVLVAAAALGARRSRRTAAPPDPPAPSAAQETVIPDRTEVRT